MPEGIQDAEMARGESRSSEAFASSHSFSCIESSLMGPFTLTCLYFQVSEDIATF